MTTGRFERGLEGGMLDVWREIFRRQKAFADNALYQLDDHGFFRSPSRDVNSVAVIVQHVAGNLLSRWTDFLTTDGEKPDRDRDAEFAQPEASPEARAALMARWEAGWAALFAALDALQPEDLGRTVTIRTKPHTVHASIARSMDHLAGHVGQIQILARWHAGNEGWKWFTIEPGGTAAFNRAMRGT